MVAPVTGPFVRYPTEPFADCYQRGYRQKPPFNLPLEYRFYRNYGTSKTYYWFTNGMVNPASTEKQADWSLSLWPGYANIRNHTYNKAYAKLQSRLGETSGWAENIAQFGAARRMFVERAVQLSHFAGALRQRRFLDAARILRTPTPSGVSHRKALAQNFLEYEYGLKPLVGDIQSSMKFLLETEFEERKISGKAGHRFTTTTGSGGSFGSNPKYAYYSRHRTDAVLQIACRARMKVTNPNLYLANQLGLIDLALPWKLIPFSFVVDWFINVEQCASAYTAWFGVELHDAHFTEFTRGQDVDFYWQNASYANGTSEGYQTTKDKEEVTCNRTIGLPGPILVMRPFEGFSIERGAQAISLVIAVFDKSGAKQPRNKFL